MNKCLLLIALLIASIQTEDYKSFIAKLNLNLEEIQLIPDYRRIKQTWL